MSGALPSGWKRMPLGHCCDIISGATPSREVAEYWGGDIPWVTPKDISKLNCAVLEDAPEKITAAGYAACSTTIIPAGSILFSSRAPIGLVAIAGRPMCTNQGFKSLVPGRDVDSGFLYWTMRRNAPRVAALGNGATFKEVSKEVVAHFEIDLPPLAEQRRIAAILDKADAIRRKRQQALTLADDFLRSAFLEMFGDLAAEGEGDVSPLGELVDQERGISYGIVQRGDDDEHGVPVVRIGDFVNNNFEPGKMVRTSGSIARKFKRTVLKGGELLLSIRGTVGRVAIAPPEARGFNVSREVAVIPLLPGVSPVFVRAAMLTPGAQRFMTENVKGVAQRGINLRDVRELPIPRPTTEMLQKYQRIDEAANRIVEAYKTPFNLFASLSQRAFRGDLLPAPVEA